MLGTRLFDGHPSSLNDHHILLRTQTCRNVGGAVGTGQAQRVLIVDDERMVSETLAHIFRRQGYEVQNALSAEQALEILSSWAPEIAIVDVSLPGMNGVELAILLASQFPKCRLLLFSGRPDSGHLVAQSAEKGKFFELIAKPVHPKLLLDWAAGNLPRPAE